MTLTYRGQKYVRIQGAEASKKAGLTYRGVSYANWAPADQVETPRLIRGVFFATSYVVKGEDRPSRMEETAYLARLFMSLPTVQWSWFREALMA